MTFNKINLPRVVTIKLQDKIKVRHLMRREHLLFHLMMKQGNTWCTLATDTQEAVGITLQNNNAKMIKL